MYTVLNSGGEWYLGVSKEVRESVRRAARKPGAGMFQKIEPIRQPFIGAWMATSAQFRNLTTAEAFARQQLVQVCAHWLRRFAPIGRVGESITILRVDKLGRRISQCRRR